LYLKKNLLNKNFIFILPNSKQVSYLNAISFAKAIIVTSDSVSMVTEACSTGKPTYIIDIPTKSKKFIDGYSSIRKITEEEKKSLKVLCQGAAIRFLLTRVFDYLNLTEGAIVKIKDPVEYLKRLEFHDSVKNYQDYFF